MTPEQFAPGLRDFVIRYKGTWVRPAKGRSGRKERGMGNQSGKVYGLTILSPILEDETQAYVAQLRDPRISGRLAQRRTQPVCPGLSARTWRAW